MGLCWAHHHAVHEGGWTLHDTPTGFTATKPPTPDRPDDLRTLTAVPDPLTGQPHLQLLPGQPTTIEPDTPTPTWAGEPFNLHWTVSILCDRQWVRSAQNHLAATGTDG